MEAGGFCRHLPLKESLHQIILEALVDHFIQLFQPCCVDVVPVASCFGSFDVIAANWAIRSVWVRDQLLLNFLGLSLREDGVQKDEKVSFENAWVSLSSLDLLKEFLI